MSTFSLASTLPKLPVPNLSNTLAKYLESIRPVSSDESFLKTKQAAESFLNGIGPELQTRLESYAASQSTSWLETWWLKLAYHSWREPLIVNSNWYCFIFYYCIKIT